MSFSVASSAARVRAPARVAASAPRAAARATSLAAAPSRGASSSSAAVVALSSKRAVVATGVVSPRASGAVATRATRASAMRIFAGRFETERTYIMIKPDGVQRGYVGEIIARFERKGNVLKGLKTFQCPKAVAEEHYQDLSEKPFFGDLVEYICSGPVVCMVWEGPGVVKSARKMIGATNPLESEPGTIRGDLAVEVGRNVIHGSDSNESAEREIALWFGGDDELVDWTPTITPWTRE